MVAHGVRTNSELYRNSWNSVALKQALYVLPQSSEDSHLFESFAVNSRYRPGDYLLRIDPNGDRFALINEGGATVSRGEIGDSIGNEMGFRWALSQNAVVPEQEISFSILKLRDASRLIRANLTSAMPRDGNFLRVSYRGPDPQELPVVLNAITEQFISVAAGQKQLQLTVQAGALREQLDVAAANLAEAETRLQRYRI